MILRCNLINLFLDERKLGSKWVKKVVFYEDFFCVIKMSIMHVMILAFVQHSLPFSEEFAPLLHGLEYALTIDTKIR